MDFMELPAEPVQWFRMGFDYAPDRPYRLGKIGARRFLHRQRAITAIAGAERVPAITHIRFNLHVRPKATAGMVAGIADGEDAFRSTKLGHPLAISLAVAVARPAHVAGMRVDN